MNVYYTGDDYEHGVYEVHEHLKNGYWLLNGHLFPGHEFLARPNEVAQERVLTGVHPIRGGFTICHHTGPRDANGEQQFWLYDIGAYPVARHGYEFGNPTFDLITDHGHVKDCWTILENYDVAGQCGMTLGSGWAELEDGTIKYFPCEKYHSSALDKVPKSAYSLESGHRFEEMSLF